MDYKINSTTQLLEQVGELNQTRQNIYNVTDLLRDYFNQISAAWESDTDDRESYLANLQKSINDLDVLNTALVRLANDIASYAINSQNIANNV